MSKRIVFPFLILFVFSGCGIWKNKGIPAFTRYGYCYDGVDKTDKMPRLDGVYAFPRYNAKTEESDDGLRFVKGDRYYVVFYADGMIANDFAVGFKVELWGTYYLSGDTIKTYTQWEPYTSMSTAETYQWFKIIDGRTIVRLTGSKEFLTGNNEKKVNLDSVTDSALYTGHFIPYDSLPDPDKSWIKQYEWFWCDKEAYKKWKNPHK